MARKNTLRERAWRLMRSLGSYTLTDLATLGEASYENIKHYHQCLIAAGYVRQVGTRKQEGRTGCDKVFRLIKNTGPKPPIQKALRFIFDPNTGEYWAENPELVAYAAGETQLPDNVERDVKGRVKVCVINPVPLLARKKPNSPLTKGEKGGCHGVA